MPENILDLVFIQSKLAFKLGSLLQARSSFVRKEYLNERGIPPGYKKIGDDTNAISAV